METQTFVGGSVPDRPAGDRTVGAGAVVRAERGPNDRRVRWTCQARARLGTLHSLRYGRLQARCARQSSGIRPAPRPRKSASNCLVSQRRSIRFAVAPPTRSGRGFGERAESPAPACRLAVRAETSVPAAVNVRTIRWCCILRPLST